MQVFWGFVAPYLLLEGNFPCFPMSLDDRVLTFFYLFLCCLFGEFVHFHGYIGFIKFLSRLNVQGFAPSVGAYFQYNLLVWVKHVDPFMSWTYITITQTQTQTLGLILSSSHICGSSITPSCTIILTLTTRPFVQIILFCFMSFFITQKINNMMGFPFCREYSFRSFLFFF